MNVKIIVKKGGEGSGDFGHAGRPGKVGGSAGSKGKASAAKKPKEGRQLDIKTELRSTDYSEDNNMWELPAGITAWVMTGHEPSNMYYGSSRIHTPTYDQITTQKGDKLIKIPGGTFILHGGYPKKLTSSGEKKGLARKVRFVPPTHGMDKDWYGDDIPRNMKAVKFDRYDPKDFEYSKV